MKVPVCDWRKPVKGTTSVCKQQEWTWTVHVTYHLDSHIVSWYLQQIAGPAPAPDVEIGESRNLLELSADVGGRLAWEVLHASPSQPMEPSACCEVTDDQLSFDDALQ